MSGHIQKRGKNSWRLKFDAGIDTSGQRHTRYFTFRGSKREAEIKLAQLVTENAKGTTSIQRSSRWANLSSAGCAIGLQATSARRRFRGMRTSCASMSSAASATCHCSGFAPSS